MSRSSDQVIHICDQADLLIVLPTSQWLWRTEYDKVRVRLFSDIGPGFSPFRGARGDSLICEALAHCYEFLILNPGTRAPGSPVPDPGQRWRGKRPFVVLAEWPLQYEPVAPGFTTTMQRGHDATALLGVDRANADYLHHRAAARQLAEDYFAFYIAPTALLEDAQV